MHRLPRVDILRAGANRDIAVGKGLLNRVIGALGVAEIVDQAGAHDPVAVVQRVNADAGDVGIDSAGLGHQLVAGVVDLLAGEHEVVEGREDFIQPGPFIDRQVGVVQTFMDAVVRRDGVAFAAVPGHVGFQVGDAAIAQLGNVGQQAGLDVAARMLSERSAPHRFQLLFRLAQQHQVVVVLLREGRARVVVDIVDQRRLV